MIIDFHTHIFPEKISAEVVEKLSKISNVKNFSDGSLFSLLNSMQKNNINFSVVLPVATNISQVEKINNSAAILNEKFFSQGIISFASMHPDFENFRTEISRIKNLGFKGLKVHPVYQNTNLDDKKFLRIFDRAAELDLIVVTHAGFDVGFPGKINCSPRMAKNVVEIIGDFKFVLAHMGGWKNWADVLNILRDTNIFIDTAFSTGKISPRKNSVWSENDLNLLDENNFMQFIKIFGADKILFGTDSPWTSQKNSINFIKKIPATDDDRNKIFGLNAEKLLF